MTIAPENLAPIENIEATYEPEPKNCFSVKVNGRDIFNLPREEVDFDPSRTENLEVQLKVNDAKAIDGNMPYIVEDVNEKIDSALTER